MYYSYVEIKHIATSFSPARTDLTVKLLNMAAQRNFTSKAHGSFFPPGVTTMDGVSLLTWWGGRLPHPARQTRNSNLISIISAAMILPPLHLRHTTVGIMGSQTSPWVSLTLAAIPLSLLSTPMMSFFAPAPSKYSTKRFVKPGIIPRLYNLAHRSSVSWSVVYPSSQNSTQSMPGRPLLSTKDFNRSRVHTLSHLCLLTPSPLPIITKVSSHQASGQMHMQNAVQQSWNYSSIFFPHQI